MSSHDLAWIMRNDAIEMTNRTNVSHIGAVLSIVDIIAVLYSGVLNVSPSNHKMPDRDRFILSKGHAGIAVYSVLAETGFFDREDLNRYYTDGGVLSGHVSHIGVPGVEVSTGSLGNGICMAAGMAVAAKLDHKTHRVIALIGDGECNEGSIWEAAMFAAHHKLDNFYVIIDNNNLQGLGYCDDVLKPLDIKAKWDAFGWDTISIDGHNHDMIANAFHDRKTGMPHCIIAHTIKGKGVSYMENQLEWHYRAPLGVNFDKAMEELRANRT